MAKGFFYTIRVALYIWHVKTQHFSTIHLWASGLWHPSLQKSSHCTATRRSKATRRKTMVQLTDVIIKGKTRSDRLDDVRNLNLWGQDITDVSILQRTPNMEVLSLSVNGISSLKHFMHCKGLKELYLRKNMVADISDIRFLMPLQHLKILWLSDNPCAEMPNYRGFVIAHLKSLEKLDNLDVTPDERKAAASIHLLPAATPAELMDSTDLEPAAEASSRSMSPSVPTSASAAAAAGQQGSVHLASHEPASSKSRVPGSKAAIQVEPWSSSAALLSQPLAVASSNKSGYDEPGEIGRHTQGLAAAGNSRHAADTGSTLTFDVAEESFAFSRQQYDPQRYSSQPCIQPVFQQQQVLQSTAAVPLSSGNAGCSHGKASPNVLYAVMALLADLDAAGLSIVQKEVDQRLRGLRG